MKILYTDKELKVAQLALKRYLASCDVFSKEDLAHLVEHNLEMVLCVANALHGREDEK